MQTTSPRSPLHNNENNIVYWAGKLLEDEYFYKESNVLTEWSIENEELTRFDLREAYERVVRNYTKLGDTKGAYTWIEKGMQEFPKDHNLFFMKVYVDIENNRVEDAFLTYQNAF